MTKPTTLLRPVAHSDPVVALLRELVAGEAAVLGELRSIRSDIRRQAAAVPIADRLLQAVHALIGSDIFTAAQLLSLVDSSLSTRLELRVAAEDIVGDLAHVGAARRFGKFLARNSQHAVNGLQLVSLGRAREGLVYRIDVATKTRKAGNWDELTNQGN